MKYISMKETQKIFNLSLLSIIPIGIALFLLFHNFLKSKNHQEDLMLLNRMELLQNEVKEQNRIIEKKLSKLIAQTTIPVTGG